MTTFTNIPELQTRIDIEVESILFPLEPKHSSAHPIQSIEVRKTMVMMGIPVDNLNMEETLDRVEEFVKIGRKTGKTHQIATVNTDFLIKASEDETLRDLLQNADMCTADGMPLIWASKLLGTPLQERVAGSDMVPLLAERAAKKGLTLYFMGAGEGVAAKAAEMLTAQYEGLQVVGTSSPFWKVGTKIDQAVLDDIKAKNPDILLVAFGNPKQEYWIQQYGKEVGVPVMIGVGASFDFIVGTTKRAPEWMQNSGLEWVSRLQQEPQRLWKRYTSNVVQFGPQLLRQWWAIKQQPDAPEKAFVMEERNIGNTTIINIEGALDHHQCRTLVRTCSRALGTRPNLTLNFSQVTRLDAISLGTLMELQRAVADAGGTMRIVGIQKEVGRLFDNLQGFFGINEGNVLHGYQC